MTAVGMTRVEALTMAANHARLGLPILEHLRDEVTAHLLSAARDAEAAHRIERHSGTGDEQ